MKKKPQATVSRRKALKTAGLVSAGAATSVAFPALVGFAKEFDGVTLQGASFSSTFFEYLKGYFPEFEEKTGMKVNFVTNAFPVFNQRTDLELSTKGSALDVINVTNRKNAAQIDPRLEHDPTGDVPLLVEEPAGRIPFLPSIGVRFRF